MLAKVNPLLFSLVHYAPHSCDGGELEYNKNLTLQICDNHRAQRLFHHEFPQHNSNGIFRMNNKRYMKKKTLVCWCRMTQLTVFNVYRNEALLLCLFKIKSQSLTTISNTAT